MNMSEGWLANDNHLRHELICYAVINDHGCIISMNQAMMQAFGYDANTAQPVFFQSLLHETDRPTFLNMLQQKNNAAVHPLPANLYTYTVPNGQPAIVWSFFHLITQPGQPAHMLCAGVVHSDSAKPLSVEEHDLVPDTRDPDYLFKMLEWERSLIGRELHDNVNQLLCSAKLHLDLLQTVKANNIQAKQKTKELIQEAIEEIRKLSRGMVPQHLKMATLRENIEEFINDCKVAHRINIQCSMHHFREDRLSDNQKITIYRILQEQLHNIIRHSQAKNIFIILETGEKDIELVIEDDGIGFNSHTQAAGMGLINIRERVRLLHGQCNIVTSPGNGCRLQIVIPV